MIDKSVSVSVIFIANISVIRISVILHIGAPLPQIIKITLRLKSTAYNTVYMLTYIYQEHHLHLNT